MIKILNVLKELNLLGIRANIGQITDIIKDIFKSKGYQVERVLYDINKDAAWIQMPLKSKMETS